MKLEEDYFPLGAACAVIAGCIVVFIDGFDEAAGLLLSEPAFVLLGLLFAALGGGALARRVVDVAMSDAIAIAILLGIVVPIATGGIAVPVIGVIGAPSIWPATIPAGLIWMVAVRGMARHPARPDQLARVAVALGLALTLLAIRFTQPAWTNASDGTRCVSFPTEDIGSIAWSPDGMWLGIGSTRDYAEGIVRVLDRSNGRIIELARGSGIDTNSAGIAVGPDGLTAYLEEFHEPPGSMPGESYSDAWIMVASPADPPRRFAGLPGPAIADLTFTGDGLAGVLWVDPNTWEVDVNELVWIREGASAENRPREISPEEADRHPVLAPLVRPEDQSMAIATGTGTRDVRRPETHRVLSATGDGREIVFVDTAFDDQDRGEDIVAISTETGRRQVLATAEAAEDPNLAGGWLAYRTLLSAHERVCFKPVELLR